MSTTASTTTANVRYDALDLIRGICMLLVLADHSGIGSPYRDTIIYHMLDHVEVVGFFVVSGFLIKNMEKPGDYVCKSASRLLIPFIVFDLLYIIILSTIGREWGQGIRNMQDLKWSIIAPGNGPIWFLRALFVSSIAYAVLKKYILVKIPIWLAGIITLIISVSAFIPADIARNQTAEGLVNGGG